MAGVAPLPVNGTVVLDTRDAGRALRISGHPELVVFVISLWQDERCIGTMHLSPTDTSDVVHALVEGLAAQGSDDRRSQPA